MCRTGRGRWHPAYPLRSVPDVRLGRPFWTFWTAAVLVNLGDGIRLAAFPLLAASLTGEPFLVALVAAAAAVPWLLTGLLAGSLADRHSARALLAGADVVRVAVLAALVGLLVADRGSIAVVGLAALALGIAETVRDVTAETVVPRLVPTALLERANGRLVAGHLVGNEFAGPLVGGALFAAGAALPFVANGATTAVAVLLVLSLPSLALSAASPPTSDHAQVPTGVRAGIAWLAHHALLRRLVLTVAAVAAADSAWFAVFVVYTDQRLGIGATGFGALLALGAGGGLLGALTADRLVNGRRHLPVLGWATVVTAGAPSLLLVVPTVWAAAVVAVVTSAGFGVFNVAAASLRHRIVPPAFLGRVTASWRTAVYTAGAIGAVAGGALASARGLDAPFVLSAAIGAAALLVWSRAARLSGPAVA
jgi:MFS family permease